ncbi:MAG: NAD-dependent epimerase/dehydratase family protein [Actinomycetota bacterium]
MTAIELETMPGNRGHPPTRRIRSRRRIRRVLVVGGAGYVGSVLVRRLLDRGYQVTVMDALLYGDEGISDLYGNPALDVVIGDLRNLEAVVSAVRGTDAVVHLGALVGDPACELDEDLAVEVNLEATRTLAAIARGLGIRRFVFASTCSVYGATDELLDESSHLAPVSLYARTKMESERLLLSMNGGTFAPVILRFGTFFGASPRARFDLVVNLLAAKAVREGELTVFGGDQWRPFLHVEDGAEAIIACVEAPEPSVAYQVFNVGADEQNHTMAEMGQIVASAVPGARLRIEPPNAVEANYRVSFERIRTNLGFLARRTIADGVAEIRDDILSGRVEDYTVARYSNVRALVEGETGQVVAPEAETLATSGAA